MAQRASKGTGRPGHRATVRLLAENFLRSTIAQAWGGQTPDRMRQTIIVVNPPPIAEKLRHIAQIATNSTRPIAERTEEVRVLLNQLTIDVLAAQAPNYRLPEGYDDDFVKTIADLLARPDEDAIFDAIVKQGRALLATAITPHLIKVGADSGSEVATEALAQALYTATTRARHRIWDIPYCIDYLNLRLGWHLCDLGVPATALEELAGALDPLDARLQEHYSENK